MLTLGASKPWPEALKALTGEDRIDGSAILEYFAPLKVWLDAENKRLAQSVGSTTTIAESGVGIAGH
jgi:peptidyl-dipeptidase A